MIDIIDLSICEPFNIKNALVDIFGFDKAYYDIHHTSKYPKATGCDKLVKHLERLHDAPVVITNGATQGLAAAFAYLQSIGKTNLGVKAPYWCRIPAIAKLFGLKLSEKYDCYLSVIPNNPDNSFFDYGYLNYLSSYHNYLGIPFIHDAAFYSPLYMPKDYKFGKIGDVQVFSISKTLGLSGLRIGYVVCHNRDFYSYIKDYVENTTIGVCSLSQSIVYDILCEMNDDVVKSDKFVERVRNDLKLSRMICNSISPNVMQLPKDFVDGCGSFAWGMTRDMSVFDRCNVKVGCGKGYGMDGYVRMNLTSSHIDLLDAVKRLSQCSNH